MDRIEKRNMEELREERGRPGTEMKELREKRFGGSGKRSEARERGNGEWRRR